jgi:hypothetical protein
MVAAIVAAATCRGSISLTNPHICYHGAGFYLTFVHELVNFKPICRRTRRVSPGAMYSSSIE